MHVNSDPHKTAAVARVCYLESGRAELCESAGQVFGALTELHGGRLVTDGGNCRFGRGHHFRAGLMKRTDIMSSNEAGLLCLTGSEGLKRTNLQEVLAGSDQGELSAGTVGLRLTASHTLNQLRDLLRHRLRSTRTRGIFPQALCD